MRMDYTDRVIIYLDFLGFTDFINYTAESQFDRNLKIRSIEKLFKLIQYYFEPHKKNDQSKIVTNFSDLIIISLDAKEIEELVYELYDLQVFLTNCILRGFFVRGIVRYGKLIHTSNIIFGPGLIQAYRDEMELAKFPRVIINPVLSRDLLEDDEKEYLSPSKPKGHFIDDIISVDQDGLYFVDYIQKCRLVIDDLRQYKYYVIALAKLLIRMIDSPKLKEKTDWLLLHYNAMINSDPLFEWDFNRNKTDRRDLMNFISYVQSEFNDHDLKNML